MDRPRARCPGQTVTPSPFYQVISGFLISSILIKGLKADTLSTRNFHARRIRRIFPALRWRNARKKKRQTMSLAFFLIWGGRWGSNPRQQESQSCALPTELRPPYCLFKKTDRIDLLVQPHQHQPALTELYLVRMKRLELLRLAALEPKSSVSTNSTTSAHQAF